MASATEAVWARIVGTPAVTDLLAVYVGVDEAGDELVGPAVFVASNEGAALPEGARRPLVVIHGPTTSPDDAKDCPGRRRAWTLRAITDNTGSIVEAMSIGEALWAAFHRLPVGLAGGAWAAACSGPSLVPSDPDVTAVDVGLTLRSA